MQPCLAQAAPYMGCSEIALIIFVSSFLICLRSTVSYRNIESVNRALQARLMYGRG